ncbi:MAG: 4-hydroxy-3-methylbut-2-en-1-yl diphosphate synthase [Campylobacteraceae bacterium]|jgi:hypothetical protein|nr:4-hydroxy-3-methylbut-2-en-1-yl diphosphate synthase [Campylobacteraceae bacterium]
MQRKKNKNYWPHAILISLGLIVLACAYTIVEALKNPVEMDTFYLQSYQEVDKNYDKIKASQESFEKKYTTYLEVNDMRNGVLHVGDNNRARIVINSKDENTCDFNVDVKLLLTRPETNRYNQNLTNSYNEKCRWFLPPVTIEKIGRWQFQAKITIGEDVGFFTYEANATQESNNTF